LALGYFYFYSNSNFHELPDEASKVGFSALVLMMISSALILKKLKNYYE